MKTTTCKFTNEAFRNLHEMAHRESIEKQSDVSVASLVRVAVDDFLRKTERRRRQLTEMPEE